MRRRKAGSLNLRSIRRPSSKNQVMERNLRLGNGDEVLPHWIYRARKESSVADNIFEGNPPFLGGTRVNNPMNDARSELEKVLGVNKEDFKSSHWIKDFRGSQTSASSSHDNHSLFLVLLFRRWNPDCEKEELLARTKSIRSKERIKTQIKTNKQKAKGTYREVSLMDLRKPGKRSVLIISRSSSKAAS